MSSPRQRAVWIALGAVLLGWTFAVTGFHVAKRSRVTAEKVAAYLNSTDLSQLKGEERTAALRDLARKMNALTIEERRRARIHGAWENWFASMTDEEKVGFIEATLPSGFKQMFASFEQMPEEKRRQAVERAMAQLEKARAAAEEEGGWKAASPAAHAESTGRAMESLTPDMQQRVVQIGLKAFYSESSAQSKAELAPLLEEMQRLMESGALFRGRR